MEMIAETPRLKVCAWTSADLPDAVKLWGDPEVMALIDVRGALNRSQVKDKLTHEIWMQDTHGVQYWKLVDRNLGVFIGCCGLRPHGDTGVFELGFHIVREHWRKGFATEAAQAVVEYAFDKLRATKLFAGHNPKNTASGKILMKLGFKYVGDQFYEPTGLDHPSYELIKPAIP